MITELVQIRLLGEKKREENLRFRRFMKSHDHSDRILRRIAEDIEEQMDCTVCGNCCKVATAVVFERDIERLARHFRITPARFVAEYTSEDDEEGRILRRTDEAGCIFLEGTTCSVYDARPDSCRRFPHLVRGNGSIASRMWEFVDRACYCPIVYNSMEAFKQELGFKR
ncbi:MAG TPA: YkgJ family cysteine cluster protein [Bryobacteraceae bacterium]|nr:YkgJ family cysteine cluster protein [Bryobacteraceae bacterium]